MKNTRAGGRSSGYEGQTLEGSIRRQGVRDCSSLGASWSKGRGGSKIEFVGGQHWNTEQEVLRRLEANLDARAQHLLDLIVIQA